MRTINTLADQARQAARIARAGRALGLAPSETAEAAAALQASMDELQSRLCRYEGRQALRRAHR